MTEAGEKASAESATSRAVLPDGIRGHLRLFGPSFLATAVTISYGIFMHSKGYEGIATLVGVVAATQILCTRSWYRRLRSQN